MQPWWRQGQHLCHWGSVGCGVGYVLLRPWERVGTLYGREVAWPGSWWQGQPATQAAEAAGAQLEVRQGQLLWENFLNKHVEVFFFF